MKKVVLLFLLIGYSQLTCAQSKLMNTNYYKLGGNVNAQIEGFSSIGLGLEYGTRSDTKVQFRSKKKFLYSKYPYGFQGLWLNLNKGILNDYSKVEMSLLSSNLFLIGLSANLIGISPNEYLGLKPIVGLSFFNMTFFYGYNILLYKNGNDINRNNFGLLYSIRFKKK